MAASASRDESGLAPALYRGTVDGSHGIPPKTISETKQTPQRESAAFLA
jgi:hypothetical protein